MLQKQKQYEKKYRSLMDQCLAIFVYGVEHRFDPRDPIFKLQLECEQPVEQSLALDQSEDDQRCFCCR